jgi:1,4-alpha-glucan branching enzyme
MGYFFYASVLIVAKHTTMIEKKYYKTKDYVKVKFSVATEAKKVELLGLNNEWKKSVIMSKKKDGTFSAEVNLPKDSRHEFKYLVDKKTWIQDTAADAEAINVFGTANSVVTV